MEKRHIINLQGRDFVTYEGLLDEAHAKGLKSIRTTLVQAPTEENGHTAICTAEVELKDGDEVRVFSGIGDANPRNVNRNIANHLIRMAETRAKARALRDAINVGMTALEELEEAELPREVGEGPRAINLVTQEGRRGKAANAKHLASKEQIEEVTRQMRRTGFTQDQGRAYLQQHFGKSSRLELTGAEIGKFIVHLASLPEAGAEAASG